MANFQLVVIPLLISVFFLFSAVLFFYWLKKKSGNNASVNGKREAVAFGYSLLVFGGFALFISLFFIITG